MVPWVYPGPHPERLVDRLGRVCRSHDRDRQTDKLGFVKMSKVTIWPRLGTFAWPF